MSNSFDSNKLSIRKGKADDMFGVFELICELAEYEHASNEVITSPAQLIEDGFGTNPLFEVEVAEYHEKIIGFVLYYPRYSTWKGPTIYLEDFIVTKEYRRLGIGKLLFDHLHSIVKESAVKRFEWQVLDWNTPAIDFYKEYKANFESDWLNVTIRF
ncbi:GNAT family N-acetyltransferase [Crocinitomix catalasitica]|uniref:GNAT family N-acetyltransferase n=1 Tax=Crocinitomix catalasitica TaxID=184607 RepID=UPI0004805569|nr:GNAT family N-acetyltransferase [Crocinitomix catalasitica]